MSYGFYVFLTLDRSLLVKVYKSEGEAKHGKYRIIPVLLDAVLLR